MTHASQQDESNRGVTENGLLNWPRYLASLEASPAPQSCFWQSTTSPENTFEAGMLLAARDNRCQTNLCIAKVTYVSGCRICLTLLGTDGLNPFWRVVDESSQIYPLSYADDEKQFKKLQPPVGFTKDISRWERFKQKYLKEGPHAPASCFHKEPRKPEKNLFKVGMKLEAVDSKDINAYVYPATVYSVDGSDITVHFDGYENVVNQSYRFDSRLLYPVGFNDLSLVKVPSTLIPSAKVSPKQKNKSKLNTSIKPSIFSEKKVKPQRVVKRKSSASDVEDVSLSKRIAVSLNKKSFPVLSEADVSGLSQNAKNEQEPLRKLAKKSFPIPEAQKQLDKPLTVKEISLSASRPGTTSTSTNCDDKQVAVRLDAQSRPDIVINSKEQMSVYINVVCNPGQFLDGNKAVKLPRQIGPGSTSIVLQEVFQTVLKASTLSKQRQTLELVPVGCGPTSIIVDMEDGKTFIRSLPSISSAQKAWEIVDAFVKGLKCCPNFISRSLNNSCACGYSKPLFPGSSFHPTYSPVSESSDSSTEFSSRLSKRCPMSKSASSWTVDNVCDWLLSQTDTSVRNLCPLFREKNIDGKALLELNGELCMKYFNVKLGTAFHLQHLIGKLSQ